MADDTREVREWRIEACRKMVIAGNVLLTKEVDALLAAYGQSRYEQGRRDALATSAPDRKLLDSGTAESRRKDSH